MIDKIEKQLLSEFKGKKFWLLVVQVLLGQELSNNY